MLSPMLEFTPENINVNVEHSDYLCWHLHLEIGQEMLKICKQKYVNTHLDPTSVPFGSLYNSMLHGDI